MIAEQLTYDRFQFDRGLGIYTLVTETQTAQASGEGFTMLPEKGAWLNNRTMVLSGRSRTVSGVGDTSLPGKQVVQDPPWIILAHELCGHIGIRTATGQEGYEHTETPSGTKSAVDIENRIRCEHSSITSSLGFAAATRVAFSGEFMPLRPARHSPAYQPAWG
jgi:hypothetical protein